MGDKPAAAPLLPLLSSMEKQQQDEEDEESSPPSIDEASNERQQVPRPLLMGSKTDHWQKKMRMALAKVLLPPHDLMAVSEVCQWALFTSFHLAWSAMDLIYHPMLQAERRLTPSQAAAARFLPRAMLWCGAAGAVAAALALLLGARRRDQQLALSYVDLAFAAGNHCLCGWLFNLILVAVTGMWCLLFFLAVISTAGIVFFLARDLVGFRSLLKQAA